MTYAGPRGATASARAGSSWWWGLTVCNWPAEEEAVGLRMTEFAPKQEALGLNWQLIAILRVMLAASLGAAAPMVVDAAAAGQLAGEQLWRSQLKLRAGSRSA